MKLKTRDYTLIALFAALTAIGAFINIPVPYVPFTLQYFFCALGAILLGSKKGMLVQLLYVGIGLIGVPVFTKGGGPQYIFQPTFGYLIGFIIGAYIIGKISENVKKLNTKTVLISTLVGLTIIYLFGVSYLYFIQNFYLGVPMSLATAIYSGMILCLGGDITLSIIISIAAPQIVSTLRKSGLVEYRNFNR
ncbi:biotin transporter BioY [Clostridium tarantellae]|uniref:Biotin transporter n=1 Tax=Clostridium tarantellae TaxID=39493 RepID=A0A6I1MHK7_9CLOT|nr:biotin transporter BioY [Clostridium tarantellae]